MWDTDNKFLNGPFTPWHEETEAFDLEVIGTIPEDLDGALFRTGSNPMGTADGLVDSGVYAARATALW
jgi:carotenoid cleavage dioxygenase-like enzyme